MANAIPHETMQLPRAPEDVILPDPSRIFGQRSRRFATLAEGHSLGNWLRFLGRLTAIQHELLQAYVPGPLPDKAALAAAREHHMPPVPASSWPRPPAWREIVTGIARELKPQAPPAAIEALEHLRTMDAAMLETLADGVVHLEFGGTPPVLLSFVAAALQVHWTALSARLGRERIALLDVPGICPCCGFPPVASIVRTGGAADRQRYLHCGLCNTQWHLVRATCAACRDGNGIAYRSIEGGDEAVRTETCDACRGYLKIFRQDRAPEADPVADDLSSLALDLLVDDAGYNRLGPNLFLITQPAEA